MTHRLIIKGELVLYGDVGDMWGDGSGFTGRDVLEALSELSGDFTCRLNSGGGFVWDGVAIYNALLAHKGKITMMIDAVAASAASVIAMAGSRVIMREGSQMMIHDPSAITWGNAADHTETATLLDRLGNQMADIYARHGDKNAKQFRQMMLAETWLSADEAIEVGLADSKEEITQDAAAFAAAPSQFDYSLYRSAPAYLMSSGQRELPPTLLKGQTMVKPVAAASPAPITAPVPPVVVAAQEVVPPALAPTPPAPAPAPAPIAIQAPGQVDETRAILARCTAARLSLADTNEIVMASNGVMATAIDMIFARLHGEQPNQPQAPSRVEQGQDARQKALMGMGLSLLMKANLPGGARNEFSGLTLREMARITLQHNGQAVPNDPMEMVARAFRPTMYAGQHTTSDFANLLADVANKAMLKGHEEAEETFGLWTSTGTLTDFKISKRVDLGLFPALTEVAEGAEYTFATMSDRGVNIVLATYGKMFAITRQAIINDDLSSFTKIPQRMGRAAKRTIGNLVYAILTANANMADGFALFSSQHANLAGAGAAPTVTTVDAGRTAMALQKDPDSHATGGLNIRPAFFLVPVELQGTANVLMTSEFSPAQTQRVPNHVRGLAQVISDARLSTHSATAWYLAANPNTIDTIEVAYLNGVQTPVLEQRDGWNVDGVEMKVRQDAGVQVFDHRGVYKNAGA